MKTMKVIESAFEEEKSMSAVSETSPFSSPENFRVKDMTDSKNDSWSAEIDNALEEHFKDVEDAVGSVSDKTHNTDKEELTAKKESTEGSNLAPSHENGISEVSQINSGDIQDGDDVEMLKDGEQEKESNEESGKNDHKQATEDAEAPSTVDITNKQDSNATRKSKQEDLIVNSEQQVDTPITTTENSVNDANKSSDHDTAVELAENSSKFPKSEGTVVESAIEKASTQNLDVNPKPSSEETEPTSDESSTIVVEQETNTDPKTLNMLPDPSTENTELEPMDTSEPLDSKSSEEVKSDLDKNEALENENGIKEKDGNKTPLAYISLEPASESDMEDSDEDDAQKNVSDNEKEKTEYESEAKAEDKTEEKPENQTEDETGDKTEEETEENTGKETEEETESKVQEKNNEKVDEKTAEKRNEKVPEEEPKEPMHSEKKEPLNYNDAFDDLIKLQGDLKNLEDFDNQSKPKKRGFEDGSLINGETKRQKTDDETEVKKLDENIVEKASRSLKKQLCRLTRSELEELVAGKVVEVIACRSEIGDLRRKVERYKEQDQNWRLKTRTMKKMCHDLSTVMKRYITDVQNNRDRAPIKITRSVGLQVLGDSKRRPIVQHPMPAALSPKKPVAPIHVPKTPPQTLVPVGKPPTHATSQQSVLKPPQISITKVNRQPVNQRLPQAPTMPPQIPLNRQPRPAPPLPNPKAVVANKNVIDVVDLSDDEDTVSPLQQAQKVTQVLTYVNGTEPATTLITNPGQFRPGSVMVQTPMVNRSPVLVSNRNMMPVTSTPLNIQRSAGPRQIFVQQPVPRAIQGSVAMSPLSNLVPVPLRHPAPPPNVNYGANIAHKLPLPPVLKIFGIKEGLRLQWDMKMTNEHGAIKSYQIYAYQEGNSPPNTSLWKKVGEVKALPLPMACTLSQFSKGNRYHFSVRAQDVTMRLGQFSEPKSISI